MWSVLRGLRVGKDRRSEDSSHPSEATSAQSKRLGVGVAVLLMLGVLLRLALYLSQPPLWGDEAMLAASLREPPWSWLSGLRYDQTAPFGFLLLSSAVVRVFGEGLLTLRAIPLLAGIASLPLFWALALKTLPRAWASIALAFLVLSPPAVYYSAEAKQYSLDLLVAIALLLSVSRLPLDARARNRAQGLGLLGILFSQSAAFVLAGSALWLGFQREKNAFRLAVSWAAAAAIGAWGYTHATGASTKAFMQRYWEPAFLPSALDWPVLGRALEGLMGRIVGMPLPWLAVGIAAWGIIRSRPRTLAPFLLPLGLTVLASLARWYPFSPLLSSPRGARLFLFALPGLILVLTHGLKHLGRHGRVAAILLLALLGYRGASVALDTGGVFYRPDITRAISIIRTDPDTLVLPPHLLPLLAFYRDREELDLFVQPMWEDGVDGRSFRRAWVYTDRVERMGETAFLERFCPERCRVIRLGQEMLLRVERDPP